MVLSPQALGLIAAEHPLPAMIIEHRQLTFMRGAALSRLAQLRQADWLGQGQG